jgi:putative oxidoreductase
MRNLKMAGTGLSWIVQVLAAAAFVAIGTGKFVDPAWARRFERWGYPDGFYAVVGLLEVAGGLLLLVPKLSSYAAALLGAVMIGALATHWVHGETRMLPAPLPWLAVFALIGIVRWRRAWRPRAPAPRPAA